MKSVSKRLTEEEVSALLLVVRCCSRGVVGPSGAGSLSCAVFWLQVGVVQYGSTVVHEFSLGEYQTVEEVVEAARSIDQRGGEETRTALGINVARYDANWHTL